MLYMWQIKWCAIHRWDQIKIDKWSTHHTWDSGNCTNADGLTERFKPWTIKRFGEDVHLLVIRMYEFKTHDFIFHQIPDEVITYLFVLWLWMLNQILREVYSTSVVTEHTYCILRNPVVVKHLLHPKKLCAATPSSYVLCFRRREWHWIFFSCSSKRQDRNSHLRYSSGHPHS